MIQNVYDPQGLNRYAFEHNNPYKYIDPTGHVYWDRLAWGILGAGLSGATALGGVYFGMGGGAAAPVTMGASVGITIAGVALATYGFANFGKSTLDIVAAWNEDDKYFAQDHRGILPSIGHEINNEHGAMVGYTADLGISALTFNNNPKSYLDYFETGGSLLSDVLTIQNMESEANEQKNNNRGNGGGRRNNNNNPYGGNQNNPYDVPSTPKNVCVGSYCQSHSAACC